MEIKEKVVQIINEIIDENNIGESKKIKINSSTVLTDDLGLDSLNLAELTVKIESEFGVDIFEKTIVRTFGEIIEILNDILD